MDIIEVLPWPPSVNHYWGHRIVGKRIFKYVKKEGKQYKEDVKELFKDFSGIPMEGDLSITLWYHPPDKRRRDEDNYKKALYDALQDAGVVKDDCQFKHSETFWMPDEKVKGVVIVRIRSIHNDEEE